MYEQNQRLQDKVKVNISVGAIKLPDLPPQPPKLEKLPAKRTSQAIYVQPDQINTCDSKSDADMLDLAVKKGASKRLTKQALNKQKTLDKVTQHMQDLTNKETTA